MTVILGAGPPATATDRLAAAQLHEAVRNELARVRAAALAWRNGVAALLAGLAAARTWATHCGSRTATGRLAALHESIDLARAAVLATPDAHAARATRLSNLGYALRLRFAHPSTVGIRR